MFNSTTEVLPYYSCSWNCIFFKTWFLLRFWFEHHGVVNFIFVCVVRGEHFLFWLNWMPIFATTKWINIEVMTFFIPSIFLAIRFDPERFSNEEVKKRHPMAFQPFGFAGKRKCPGYRFSYAEVAVVLSVLLRRFKIHLVDGQVVEPEHALVTQPKEEIWITVTKRWGMSTWNNSTRVMKYCNYFEILKI